jgi:hypothetical protein
MYFALITLRKNGIYMVLYTITVLNLVCPDLLGEVGEISDGLRGWFI